MCRKKQKKSIAEYFNLLFDLTLVFFWSTYSTEAHGSILNVCLLFLSMVVSGYAPIHSVGEMTWSASDVTFIKCD